MKNLKIPRGLKANEKLVDAWKDVPTGTAVIVIKDLGEEFHTKTAGRPFMLGGHTACIMVEGIVGAYALSRVRKA